MKTNTESNTIEYTLDMFLAGVKFRNGVTETLDKIANTLEKLNDRLDKLETEETK